MNLTDLRRRPAGVAGLLLLGAMALSCSSDPEPAGADLGLPDRGPVSQQLDLPVFDLVGADLPGVDAAAPAPDLWAVDTAPSSQLRDHSVNQASATSAGGGVVVLSTQAQQNAAGAFNGSGTGNKAILGVAGYDGVKLASLSAIEVQATRLKGKGTHYLNLLVDLTCAGGALKILVYDQLKIGTSSFDLSKDSFRVVRNLDGKNTPPWLGVSYTLAQLTKDHPAACLRDAVSHDSGMPAGVKLSALLVILGDSMNQSEHQVKVTSLKVGGVVIQ